MHKSKLRRITLAVYFALMPVAADAAGLGKLTVISGLGEPLNAEIELLSTTPEELSTLTAAIAPEEAYAVQGLERSALHTAIQVEVGKKPNGEPVLKLSTRQPVSDPFLDMLIQVDWATGRLLREYTVLLDPPGYSNNAPIGSAAVRAPTTQASPSPAAPATAGDASTATPAGQSAANQSTAQGNQTSQAPDESAASQEYTTVQGDTLSSIARRLQVEDVSLEQMLTGLYNANEDAFVGGNMNRLRVGQIIRVPGPEELQSISRTDAAQQVRVHSADWNAYRNRLAGVVADAAPSAEDTDTQTSGGKITTAAEDKAAPSAAGPRDVVKLSKSDANAASGDSKAMQDRINALQEEVIAKEQATQEANERTALLEKQIADMQKLLAIKNQSLAEMQKNASGAVAAPAPAATEQNPAADTPNVPDADNVPASEPAQTAAATPEAATAEAAPPVAPPAEQAKPVEKPKKKITPPPPPPVEEPGILDGLAEDPMLLAVAGGSLVLLGGGWLFLRNRRRRNLDSFEQGILTAGGLKANTVFGNTAGGTVDTGDTSFLTDFSQSSGGMIDTHDVDPIAEAEVYMAYGRDAQAEEILKDAIAKEPQRYELHLKLLEIIANRKDTAAFETIAGELYSTLGSNDPTWLKVAQMGQQLEPGNPLYDTKGAGGVATAAVVAGAASAAVAAEKSRLDVSDFDNVEEMNESSLDFSLGNEAGTQQPADVNTTPAAQDIDFDLGIPSADAGGNSLSAMTTMSDSIFGTTEEPQAEAAQTSNELHFDLGDTSGSATTAMPAAEDFGSTVPGLDMPGLEADNNVRPTMADTSPISAAVSDEAVSNDMGLSFDMPELGVSDGATEMTSVHQASPSQEKALPSFDDATLGQAPAAEAEEDIRFEPATDSAPSFDLPELDTESMQVELPASENQGLGLDFNFENETGETALNDAAISAQFEPLDEEAPNPSEIDLSGITLDFGPTIDNPDTTNDNFSSNGISDGIAADAESPEVETKLDLVTAYMEMGDKEGARELLDEVLKEGGPQQKARAQEMLGNIG